MDNKIILIIAVAAVVVVGGVGAAVMLGNDGADEVIYHGNGYKTSNGESTFHSIENKAYPCMFESSDKEMYNWNTKADGSGTTVKVGEEIPSGVKDLYAQWVGTIHFTRDTVLQPQYDHIKISSSTTIQGETVNKAIDNNFGFIYNGTDTRIIFECDTDCDVYVNSGYVVFQMEDGSCASFNCVAKDLGTLSSKVSSKTAEVTFSDNVGGDIRVREDVLEYTVDFRNEDNLGFHVEAYCDVYDDPVAFDSNPCTNPAFDRSEFEIRIVCDESNSEVFGCQPSSADKTFSYRTNSMNQPTVHYRVTSSNDGYVYTGELVGNASDGYANYFLISVGLAMSYDHVEPNTQFIVEISSTAFSS